VAALSDDEIGDFAKGLRKLLRLYADLGVWSFNLMFFPDSNGSGADTHWLTAQLVPRLYLNSVAYVTDVSYPQLLMGERLSMVYPEETAAKLALGR
jgi:galactose-1-phosphate uridylyltransferase